jgi:threonine/homoserine/homoserine lactone efflux protein
MSVPSAANLLAFSLVALIIIVIPGPSVLFSVGRALAWGKKAAIISVVGNAVGVGIQILAVALGLGALVLALPPVFVAMKVVGATIVLFLGIQAIIHRHDHLRNVALGGPPRKRRLFLESIGVGITNPKTIVFFVATLPAFVSASQGSVLTQMVVLGAVFLVIGVTSDGVWALGAGFSRDWFAASPTRLSGIRAGGGAALSGLGVYMLYDAWR